MKIGILNIIKNTTILNVKILTTFCLTASLFEVSIKMSLEDKYLVYKNLGSRSPL